MFLLVSCESRLEDNNPVLINNDIYFIDDGYIRSFNEGFYICDLFDDDKLIIRNVEGEMNVEVYSPIEGEHLSITGSAEVIRGEDNSFLYSSYGKGVIALCILKFKILEHEANYIKIKIFPLDDEPAEYRTLKYKKGLSTEQATPPDSNPPSSEF